jgi:hypothetical protein
MSEPSDPIALSMYLDGRTLWGLRISWNSYHFEKKEAESRRKEGDIIGHMLFGTFGTPLLKSGIGLARDLLGFEAPLLSDPVGLSMTDICQNGV